MKYCTVVGLTVVLAIASVGCDKEESPVQYSATGGNPFGSQSGSEALGFGDASSAGVGAMDSGAGVSAGGSGGSIPTGGVTTTGGTSANGGLGGVSDGFDAAIDGAGPSGSGGMNPTGGTGSIGGNGGTGGSGGTNDCSPPQPGSTGSNPLFTDTYTADPAPLVYNCTFYITCGHDEGSTGFFLKEWYLLSSTDMVNWERKVAFGVDLFSWANANAWAGQMVEKDGTFYWYVPVQKLDGTMAIGVAKADSPDGPFVDAIGGPLVDDTFEKANMGFPTPSDTPYTIDPTAFVDDDGKAYLQYGGFWRLINAELNDDMISIKGTMIESTPNGFFEAPFLTKRNNIYYEVYAADQNPATIDYATSNSPLGPWQYKGRILDTLPNNPGEDYATSHPGIAEFAEQWYLVYHLSNGSAGTYRRQVAIEKLNFNDDGSIQQVVPSDGLQF